MVQACLTGCQSAKRWPTQEQDWTPRLCNIKVWIWGGPQELWVLGQDLIIMSSNVRIFDLDLSTKSDKSRETVNYICYFLLISLQHTRRWITLHFIIFKEPMLFRTKEDLFPMLELSKWSEVGQKWQVLSFNGWPALLWIFTDWSQTTCSTGCPTLQTIRNIRL